MRFGPLPVLAVALACVPAVAIAAEAPDDGPTALFQSESVQSAGSVTVGGSRIGFHAIAGTLVVHAKGWEDTDALDAKTSGDDDAPKGKAEASMFYTAYFKDGAPSASRPVTFLFNGGPGSSTVWLHMGAFGPVRVQTADNSHTPPAPYGMVNNDASLLDASDLVFIDAPGTGFSRIAGPDKDKAFYGVDQDIDAFAQFIGQFLSKYNRWNSPKYLFGESYGTMRGAGLALALQNQSVDLNGVILLSDILNWDLMPDDPQVNPSVDLPYIVALPTYAATAWYHHKLAERPDDLGTLLKQVEGFATGDYAQALMQGNALPEAERQRIAAKMAAFTGLPVNYLLKTNLRIEYGAFQKELLADRGLTTGTLDTRFTGATLDPLSKVAQYDPQGSAIGGAYIAAFNQYVRSTLHYGEGKEFKPDIDVYGSWDYRHQPPGAGKPLIALPNVLPDLAVAMKNNPTMKVMVNGGYFDVSTPYFEGVFEMRHLPVPADLQANVEYSYYQSGHMVYAHLPSLHELHDKVAAFIRRTDGEAR
ncbi:S10 family peptidase [Novosphingobium album (ex Hu et al. 2023)]|uniref:Peptidase S10 n=1 Tax=Novosphingobium album (ex Hu et al. 2023) TaxID=2930093 RepID=A0ABT0B2N3_9SPHN|nr:peptidase S10 [Novosphingobium album (ex Hu et al. 2023)]MCJ2179069.1 peptidase S10 [Novosphingobium album (ex Hu et al. 2023)]